MHYGYLTALVALSLISLILLALLLRKKKPKENLTTVLQELLAESQMRETRLLNLMISKDLPTFQSLQFQPSKLEESKSSAPPMITDIEDAFRWADNIQLPVGALSDSADGDLTEFESGELRKLILGESGTSVG